MFAKPGDYFFAALLLVAFYASQLAVKITGRKVAAMPLRATNTPFSISQIGLITWVWPPLAARARSCGSSWPPVIVWLVPCGESGAH